MAVEFPVDIIMNDVSLDADAEIYTPEITEDDYSALANKPSINGVVLVGDKTTEELGIDHVALADNLVARTGTTNTSPYSLRPAPSYAGSVAELRKVVGGTLAWNELRWETTSSQYTYEGCTTWYDGDTHLFHIRNDERTALYTSGSTRKTMASGRVLGHKYIFLTYPEEPGLAISDGGVHYNANTVFYVDPSRPEGNNFSLRITNQYDWVTRHPVGNDFTFSANVFDLTVMFGSTIADAIYTADQTTQGTGATFIRNLFPSAYYPYSAGSLQSVQTSARKVVGFNQWDEEWQNGYYSDGTGAYTPNASYFCNKNPIPVIAGTVYNFRIGDNSTFRFLFYDAQGNFLSSVLKTAQEPAITVPSGACKMNFCGATTNYGAVYKHDICINISNSALNGTYKSYESKSYPLDSDLTLRGIPKLTNGALYYDGDIYLPTGEVTRKYEEVDLGDLTWQYNTSLSTFYAYLWNPAMKDAGQCICSKYVTYTGTSGANMGDKNVFMGRTGWFVGAVTIKDSDYTDRTTFASAVVGVKLVYELATPTTETADPYSEVQLVDNQGSEQFVTTNSVPVGNETFYPMDLTGVVQDLAPLPTTAGTYKLQVTDSGGVPSYSWVAG